MILAYPVAKVVLNDHPVTLWIIKDKVWLSSTELAKIIGSKCRKYAVNLFLSNRESFVESSVSARCIDRTVGYSRFFNAEGVRKVCGSTRLNGAKAILQWLESGGMDISRYPEALDTELRELEQAGQPHVIPYLSESNTTLASQSTVKSAMNYEAKELLERLDTLATCWSVIADLMIPEKDMHLIDRSALSTLLCFLTEEQSKAREGLAQALRY
ncbi:hypothetical protein LX59_03008 [Azomonas agilis]|uniref:BRO family protein n=2 Tax=Azomonas agilis TaxID=116849 RepID=A0A562HZ74_9GAMM|nr:hypothetical protein LX59_03008 [Azomonas agilis]